MRAAQSKLPKESVCALLRGGATTAIDKSSKGLRAPGQSELPKESMRALLRGRAKTAIDKHSKGMRAGQSDLPKKSMRALLRGGAKTAIDKDSRGTRAAQSDPPKETVCALLRGGAKDDPNAALLQSLKQLLGGAHRSSPSGNDKRHGNRQPSNTSNELVDALTKIVDRAASPKNQQYDLLGQLKALVAAADREHSG